MVWTAAWTDFVICLLFGWLGVHKFREKKIGMGILYLCTFGLFCIGWFVDCIRYLLAALHGASRATDQCRFQQMLHYQLCHQM